KSTRKILPPPLISCENTVNLKGLFHLRNKSEKLLALCSIECHIGLADSQLRTKSLSVPKWTPVIGHRGKPGMKAPLEVVPHAGSKACPSIGLRCLPVLLIQSHFFSRTNAYGR